ncbi:MAG TPA: hypothetical protein DEA96_11500 [Leptospiraceae bacterium]|nr:hypothetical protein [Spirochaetaceae bacterium]HBS05585.1 hypothetical protein [Leptospiraceae bacterium]
MNRSSFKNLVPVLSAVILFLASSCTSRSIIHRAQAPVAIGSESASCKVVAEDGQWQAVWDMYRLWDADFSGYQFQASRTYNYTMEDQWLDWVVNGALGFFTTVTRHTVLLQECDQEVVIRTPEQIQKQLDDTIAQHLKDQGTSRPNKLQPIFIMKDGASHQGRLVEIREDAFEIEVEVQPESASGADGEEASTTVDRVRLKNGEVLDGRVVDQNRTSMTIRLKKPEGGSPTKTISKADIAQVQFGISSEEAERETKRMTLDRNQIERIALP